MWLRAGRGPKSLVFALDTILFPILITIDSLKTEGCHRDRDCILELIPRGREKSIPRLLCLLPFLLVASLNLCLLSAILFVNFPTFVTNRRQRWHEVFRPHYPSERFVIDQIRRKIRQSLLQNQASNGGRGYSKVWQQH